MGANLSRDGEESVAQQQQQHPSRLSRLGSRPPNRMDNPSLRMPNHEHTPRGQLIPVVLRRSPVQRSGIVANVVNLVKSSLSVVPANDDPRVLLLNFSFSASVPGYISVYYCARQLVHRGSGSSAPVRRVSYEPLKVDNDNTETESNAGKTVEKTRFPVGKALQYRQKRARGLRLDLYEEDQLTGQPDGQCPYYPVVIRIEARHPADSTVPKRARVMSQSTFCVLTRKKENDSWGIRMVRQEVLVGGTVFVLEELFGIGAVDVTASRSEKVSEESGVKNVFSVDKGSECVICLTESCNTAVLPCNHLCLCQDCAAKLSADPSSERRRCPICRTDLESLLLIVPTSLSTDDKENKSNEVKVNQVSSAAGGEAASNQIDRKKSDEVSESKVEDESSLSSGVSDSSSREEDGAVTPIPTAGPATTIVSSSAAVVGPTSVTASIQRKIEINQGGT